MRDVQRLPASLLVLTLVCVPALFAADHPMIGQAAPAFDLPSLDGGQVSSSDLRGKVIVLHFGAGW